MSTTQRWLRGAFHELSPAECRALLAKKSVGRIAFWTAEGPSVLPVNYVVDDAGEIRFRTSPYASIAQYAGGAAVAFQVDEVDDFTQSGWSVMARGVAEVVLGARSKPEPEPWPDGVRSVQIRVRPESLTGRRVLGH